MLIIENTNAELFFRGTGSTLMISKKNFIRNLRYGSCCRDTDGPLDTMA